MRLTYFDRKAYAIAQTRSSIQEQADGCAQADEPCEESVKRCADVYVKPEKMPRVTHGAILRDQNPESLMARFYTKISQSHSWSSFTRLRKNVKSCHNKD